MDSDFKILAISFGAIFAVMIGASWWDSYTREENQREAAAACAARHHPNDVVDFKKCVDNYLEVLQ